MVFFKSSTGVWTFNMFSVPRKAPLNVHHLTPKLIGLSLITSSFNKCPPLLRVPLPTCFFIDELRGLVSEEGRRA